MTSMIRGVLFDKDGTLFDFQATWNAWARKMLLDLAKGDTARAAALGMRIGFDFAATRFDRDSPVIAGTPGDIVRLLMPGVPEMTPQALMSHLNESAALAPQQEVVPLGPLLERLRALGLALGVATNDAEEPARAHLEAAGQGGAFDFIAGYDSGYGGKPEPGMCLGFARKLDIDPGSVAMVGDSSHDLHAGRAAGMICVAVLTGMASQADLEPLADVVLPDIGHLPDWIAARNAGVAAS